LKRAAAEKIVGQPALGDGLDPPTASICQEWWPDRASEANVVLPFAATLHRGDGGLCRSASLARELQRLRHEVRLIPPACAKPLVKQQKNDAADAQAICETAQRPTMRFVPVKSEEQQASPVVFLARDFLVHQVRERQGAC
jgi:hypothetical protein